MAKQEAKEIMWMSLAYIDAGISLAEQYVEGSDEKSYHRSLVPIFLIHQGIELLYKAAIKAMGIEFPKTHDLRRLRTIFQKHYPDIDFEVPSIVLGASDNNNANQLNLFAEFKYPQLTIQHERLRYPTDRQGKDWSFQSALDIEGAMEDITELNRASLKCWMHINDIE